jgi:hypothetical protein
VLYLGWVDGDDVTEVPEGPWEDGFVLRPGLVLLASTHPRSVVYHGLKWSQPEGRAVLVAPLADAPKAKGMAPGLKRWLQAAESTSGASTSSR